MKLQIAWLNQQMRISEATDHGRTEQKPDIVVEINVRMDMALTYGRVPGIEKGC